MNNNLRTAALIGAGIVGAASVTAEEAKLNPVETALSATTISGYVSTSALFDVTGTKGGVVLPGRSFDQGNGAYNKIDQINLDVVKLTIEKAPSETEWSAGYKADLLFGPDANLLATTSRFGYNTSDFAVKQAYVALRAPVGNGLTAKVGVFDTVIGYEVFEAGNNPNYSRSYAYAIEPTQHTGVLLTYQATEAFAINAGVANAYNSRINAPGGEPGSTKDFGIQTYMGSLSLTAPESFGSLKGATLYAGIVHGLSSVPDALDGDPRTSIYGGLTVPLPVTGLAAGVAYDYRFTERYRGLAVENAPEYATAMAGYLTYEVAKQVKLNVRGEYATGSAGTWGAKTVAGRSNEEFFALTGTIDINLWDHALTRLEVRWDQDLTEGGGAFGNGGHPKDEAIIAGVNVIYKF